jgi:hypothetical protein
MEKSTSKLGMERNCTKEICFTKILLQRTELRAFFRWQNALERNSELLYFYFCCKERNSELFFLPRNGLEQNSEFHFYFCSTVQSPNFQTFKEPKTPPGCVARRAGTITLFLSVPSPHRFQHKILCIFLLLGMVQKGIPGVFYSAEQSEFRRNKPIVPSILSSAK